MTKVNLKAAPLYIPVVAQREREGEREGRAVASEPFLARIASIQELLQRSGAMSLKHARTFIWLDDELEVQLVCWVGKVDGHGGWEVELGQVCAGRWRYRPDSRA